MVIENTNWSGTPKRQCAIPPSTADRENSHATGQPQNRAAAFGLADTDTICSIT
jgi:hypothetical protein